MAENTPFEMGPREKDEHVDYLGKVGDFSNSSGRIFGVYRGIEEDSHGYAYAIFNPSIIYSPENEAVVVSERNSKLIMPLVVIKPIIGSLEQWAMRCNEEKRKVELKNSQQTPNQKPQ
jgi:hypothetical protein